MSWRSSKRRKAPFELLFACVFLLVVLFVGWNLWVVVEGGTRALTEALASKELRFAIKMSLCTTTISTAFCMALALPCAYTVVSRNTPLTRIGEAVLALPLSLPYLVLGICLLTAFSTPFGKALKEIGFRVVFHPRGIVMAQVLVNLPFAVQLVTEALRRLDPELGQTAQTFGASRAQVLRYITLPLCRADFVTAAILSWSRGLGEFGATLMLVGVTRMKTETLPGNIYLNVCTGEYDAALAAALVLLILSFLAQLTGRIVTKRRDYG